MANRLNIGDTFPEMTLQIVGGGTLNLPTDLAADYNIILFYRGHW